MSSQVEESSPKLRTASPTRWAWRVGLFVIIVVVGEFYVKWFPYYNKAFIAAAKHSIGSSIITGSHHSSPPPVSIQAAWNYAQHYFMAVWQAVILGIVVGAAVQTLIPKAWILRLFSQTQAKSIVTASALSLPGMMCTCCAAPIAAGMRKQQASVGAALAFWMGNPVLNPATIIFIAFVLGWKFAVMRIVFGLVLVLLVGFFANHFFPSEMIHEHVQNHLPDMTATENTSWTKRFFTQIGKMTLTIVPVYILLVLVVGAARAWLFPAVHIAGEQGIAWVIGLAITGMLFVIPTAGEVPIIQSLMNNGLAIGPAMALLLTLPAISAPSAAMVWRYFPKRALLLAAVMTVITGIVDGLLAMAIF